MSLSPLQIILDGAGIKNTEQIGTVQFRSLSGGYYARLRKGMLIIRNWRVSVGDTPIKLDINDPEFIQKLHTLADALKLRRAKYVDRSV